MDKISTKIEPVKADSARSAKVCVLLGNKRTPTLNSSGSNSFLSSLLPLYAFFPSPVIVPYM